jgi:NAD(P)-dependent dehydrogenase (short-subunit alcohol dehydrogenase family)
MSIKDKVILISGAGKGAGAALARALANNGARVAANDISPVNVVEVVNEIHRNGGKAQAFIADIAKKVAVQALVKEVEDTYGNIDFLINHAAVMPSDSLLNMDEWDWQRTLDVNLTGAFLMTQSMGRMMRERGSGVIINIVDPVVGEEGSRAAYYSSMAGLMELTRQTEREVSRLGIKVHLVVNTGEAEVVDQVLRILA